MNSQKRVLNKQTNEERLELRKRQRTLAERILGERENIMNVNSDVADKLYKEEEKLFDKVGATREACVDSNLFRTLSSYTVKQAFLLGEECNKVNTELFLTRLKEQRFKPDNLGFDWKSLGKDVSVFFSGINQISFMLGPMSVPQKALKRRERVQKAMHEIQKPVQLTQDEEKEETQHEKFQNFLFAELERKCNESNINETNHKRSCVEMFRFLTNPLSFSQTVENIFEFSFLVKDGWAGVGLGPNDLPVIYPENPEKDRSTQDKQAVITFNLKDWEAWKSIYDLENESILPNRE